MLGRNVWRISMVKEQDVVALTIIRNVAGSVLVFEGHDGFALCRGGRVSVEKRLRKPLSENHLKRPD